MSILRNYVRVIDFITEYTGRTIARCSAAAMVLILCYEVIMRHIFNAPTIWAHETMMMMGVLTGSAAMAYTLKVGGHLRIDLIYGRLSPNWGQPITDIIGYITLFVPVMVFLLGGAILRLLYSWEFNETFVYSYWRPPTWPIKAIFLLGFSLLVFQGIAEFIKAWCRLRRKPL